MDTDRAGTGSQPSVGAAPIRVCRIEELPAGTARGFDPHGSGEDTHFVLRRGDLVRAFRNRCPHQGVRLEYRKDRFLSADGERVICYAHGAHFDADSGLCVHGPCLGQSLEAVRCWMGQGWIYVSV